MRDYNAQLQKEFRSGNYDDRKGLLADEEDEHSDNPDDIDDKSDDDEFISEIKK